MLVKNSICDIEGKEYGSFVVKLSLKNSSCDVKQAIGYYLYMLQAAGFIGLEQKSRGNPSVRKVRFSTSFDQSLNQYADLICESNGTEFGRLAL